MAPLIGKDLTVSNAYRLTQLGFEKQKEVVESIRLYRENREAAAKPKRGYPVNVGDGTGVWREHPEVKCICSICGNEHERPHIKRLFMQPIESDEEE